MNKMYVDDVNMVMESLALGTRWTGSKMEWREEWEEEEKIDNEKDDKRSMREVRKMSNSILPYIQFTEEVASECPGQKLPMLDFQVWQEERTNEEGEREIIIQHEYYEKPMASKLMMMERSAMPHRMKVATLSQEVVRRLKNTARTVQEWRRRRVLSRMMVKLKRSGFGEKMRRKIRQESRDIKTWSMWKMMAVGG